MTNAQELSSFAEELLRAQKLLGQQLRRKGIDPQFLAKSGSRLKYLLNNGNLSAISQLSQTSPTITTRLDQLRNEIFRYISQVNQIQSSNPSEVFIQMQQAIDDLVKAGKISSKQRTEAQAAGLGTLFNISAFKTFQHSNTNQANALEAAREMLRDRKSTRLNSSHRT